MSGVRFTVTKADGSEAAENEPIDKPAEKQSYGAAEGGGDGLHVNFAGEKQGMYI